MTLGWRSRAFACAAAALACGFASAASAAPLGDPSVEEPFRIRVSGGFYGGDYQSIAVRKVTARDGGDFWMVEQRKRATLGAHGPTIRIERRWVDARSCPALTPIIETLSRTLGAPDGPAPRASSSRLPALQDLPEIPTFHGNWTYLGVLKPGGGYDVRSDYEGAITAWWRTTEQALAACWGYSRRMVDGRALPLSLETDADEAPYIELESKR